MLGVMEQCTPLLLDNIAHAASCGSSFAETREMLARQGVLMSVAKIQSIASMMSRAARTLRSNDNQLKTLDLQGKTLVISTDGGRLRTRQKKRGRKTKRGRNRYDTPWREPKVICIYVVDNHGDEPRIDKELPVILDGTLGDASATFTLIETYLGQLKIVESTKVLFIADGANWIWDRVPQIREQLRSSGCQFIELVDFYHVSETIHQFASFKSEWSSNYRKRWAKRMCKYLKTGQREAFREELMQHSRYARKGTGFLRAKNYLLKRLASGHLDYDLAESLKLPLGSGSVESTIRRIVNLRLKNASMFWRPENAEDLLVLRSFYKSGRHENIIKQGLKQLLLV
jgi:hypothetical protein